MGMIRALAALALLACNGATHAATATADVSHYVSESTRALDLPFSDAVRIGDLLVLSGQIGNLPGTTELAPGGISGEAKQVLENIRAILEANGSELAKVVKCTVMIADINEWGEFNDVYVSYFPGKKPARSAFGANGLAFGARVEMECWATP